MRVKMIAFAGISLLLLAGCEGKSPLNQADNSCVQKPVCAAPAQPPAAAPAPPESYAPTPRPRRAARYRKVRRGYDGYASRTRYAGGGYRYESETRDYGQVYSTGDTRYAGTRVQVQTTDSYTASGSSSYSASGYAGGYSYGGGSGYVATGGCPGSCGPERPRAAGRDRNGYLTWPSK